MGWGSGFLDSIGLGIFEEEEEEEEKRKENKDEEECSCANEEDRWKRGVG